MSWITPRVTCPKCKERWDPPEAKLALQSRRDPSQLRVVRGKDAACRCGAVLSAPVHDWLTVSMRVLEDYDVLYRWTRPVPGVRMPADFPPLWDEARRWRVQGLVPSTEALRRAHPGADLNPGDGRDLHDVEAVFIHDGPGCIDVGLED